jgi:uncharacterized protein with ATP-grasp and redox domains
LMKRILMEIREVDPSREMEVMVACTKKLAENFYDGVVSAECATKVHKLAYELLGQDPYVKLKEKSNSQAQALFPRAREFVRGSEDPFRAAVLCSIVGNVLDYGINKRLDEPDFLLREFETLLGEGLGVDQTPEIKAQLDKGGRVLFFPDNAGEIIFDQLLLEQMREYDIDITLVVKGEPILTDVTMEDVHTLGLESQVDGVITTGAFAVGFPFWNMGRELKVALDTADFIISKGMGNFECFGELDYGPIAYLMRTKCKPVAEALEVPIEKNVAIFKGRWQSL